MGFIITVLKWESQIGFLSSMIKDYLDGQNDTLSCCARLASVYDVTFHIGTNRPSLAITQ
jgi:hypothetical protein